MVEELLAKLALRLIITLAEVTLIQVIRAILHPGEQQLA